MSAGGYAKVITIHSTMQSAIAYIMRTDRVQENHLIYGFQCSEDSRTAAKQFEATVLLAKHERMRSAGCKDERKEVLGYHFIQSFAAEDSVTPEQAHQMGKEWAQKICGDRFEYVLATHTNTGHIHNHLIINATSYLDFKKFESKKYQTLRFIRQQNNIVRAEHGLQNGLEWTRGKSTLQNPKRYVSFQSQLRTAITEVIRRSDDWDDFKKRLVIAGIEMKEGTHLSFCYIAAGQKRFTRDDKLGASYSRFRIEERISKQSYPNYVRYVARQTMLHKTRELANALVMMRREEINSFSDFGIRIHETEKQIEQTNLQVEQFKHHAQTYRNIAYVLDVYRTKKQIADQAARKLFGKKKFEKAHEGDLRIFHAAELKLKQIGVPIDAEPTQYEVLAENSDRKAEEIRQDVSKLKEQITELNKAKTAVGKVLYGESYTAYTEHAQRSQPVYSQEKAKPEKSKSLRDRIQQAKQNADEQNQGKENNQRKRARSHLDL